MHELDLNEVSRCAHEQEYDWAKSIGPLQNVVYTMVGGGMLGRFAAHQPAGFYIDDRVGRLPYSRKEIEQAVEVLVIQANALGLNPNDLPPMPDFHGCGVF